jgi:hypothetical protein
MPAPYMGAEAQMKEQYAALYKTKQWKAMRARQLTKHPYCQCPHCEGKRIPANTVDHVDPHQGDTRKFYGGKLQSLTHSCHSKMKQSQERGGHGFDIGCNVNGEPLNKTAAWYT